ncbi:MAG: TolC family protein [Colwellia sp.]|nr:TolC family protein [Colwellia sp.]
MKFHVKKLINIKPNSNWLFIDGNLKFKHFVLIIIPFISGATFTQDSYAQKINAQESTLQTIDLRSAITQTINKHPDLKTFTNQADVYRGYVQQAGVQSRPTIGFLIEDALGTGEHSGLKSAQSTLSLSWLLDGQLAKSRMSVAKVKGNTLALEREIKVLDLAAQTARYFIQVLVQQERLKLANLSLKQANSALIAVNKRVKAGKSSLVDKLKLQAEVATRALIADDLTHEIDASKYQLLAQWHNQEHGYANSNLHKKAKIIGSLLSLPKLSNIDVLLTQLKQSPLLSIYATKQRIAQSKIEFARIETKPLWQFSTGLRRYETTDDFGLVAGVSIPFGESNQNQGKINALRASQNQLETESLALVHKLNTQLYVRIEQMKHSLHVIDAVTVKIIPVLERAFEEAEKAFNIGLYSYTEWMNTQQALLNAQSDLIDAYQNAHLNNIEIERLTGSSLFSINNEHQ